MSEDSPPHQCQHACFSGISPKGFYDSYDSSSIELSCSIDIDYADRHLHGTTNPKGVRKRSHVAGYRNAGKASFIVSSTSAGEDEDDEENVMVMVDGDNNNKNNDGGGSSSGGKGNSISKILTAGCNLICCVQMSPQRLLKSAFSIRAFRGSEIRKVSTKVEMLLKSNKSGSALPKMKRCKSNDNLPSSQSQMDIQMMSHTLAIKEVKLF